MFSRKNMSIHFLSISICFIPVYLNAYKPTPTMETERCVLRQISVDDAQALFPLASHPDVAKYTPFFGSLHKNPEQTAAFIKERLECHKQGTVFPWVIIEKSTMNVIGIIQLFCYSPTHRRAEVGYFLLPDYWNRGITTEVTNAVISFGFRELQLIRLQATTDPRNEGSVRVITKCGMRLEGVLRNYYIVHNEYCDRSMYSLTDTDFFQ